MNERTLPTALRWAARWRAAARIARRDAARHRGRTALVAALVALPLVAGSAGLVLLRSTVPSDASIVRDSLGSTVQARITHACPDGALVPTDDGTSYSCDNDDDSAPLSVLELSAALDGSLPAGDRALPMSSALVDYAAGTQSRSGRSYAEIDLTDDDLGTLAAVEEGRAPEDPSEILVSGHMARSAPLDVGDTVALRQSSIGTTALDPVELTVVGISRIGSGVPADFIGIPGSSLDPFDAAAGPTAWYVTGDAPVLPEHAEQLFQLGFTVLSREAVGPSNGSQMSSPLVSRLTAFVPSGTLSGVALVAVIIAALLEAALLIGPAFVVGARRETRNLALVAATGGEPADLRRIVLSTGLVVGGGAAVGGTVIGAATGAALLPALRTQDIYVPNLAIPVAELLVLALAGTALALAAAWLPARQAARTDVVSALSGRRPVTTPARRRPVVGLVTLGIGILAAVVGALLGRTPVLIPGLLVLEVGVILLAAPTVQTLARVADRAGPAVRYALRDADRHRARTAPALAAIIAATAVAGAGVTFQASSDASMQRLDTRPATVGTLVVGLTASSQAPTADDAPPVSLEDGVDVYEVFLTDSLGDVPITEVRSAVPPSGNRSEMIDRLRPESVGCPTLRYGQDPRCSAITWGSSPFNMSTQKDFVIVDDGSVVRALGLPDSDVVADALATEHAVVASERDLWTDASGSTFAHLAVPGIEEPVVVPAVAHTWGEVTYRLILPPEVVSEIGWTSSPVGLVVPEMGDVTDAQRTALRNLPQVPGIYALAEIEVERLTPSGHPLAAMVTGLLLLSTLATWIVVGLAASESRPDLATISAIGASPRTRRRLAGAQAGVLAVVGTGLGLVTGVFFGGMFVLSERTLAGGAGWAWQLDVPWLFLALIACTAPLLAIAGAALATRSRLPLGRRLAS
ncbi:FtsX-like permease family protein [Sanguibacter antarcticus]|uniref:Putative ABC transport system permease protein n=1 Tax=Sanguibacter antarcticus TaxID=372484 RepID=A0A2A9E155_9MICO|nr:FtsX-like permease family protein [Sanguibacter antarcticus]PFG32678.1 putative ABC transport system permease protein [Sanguibacter antarcticus]